MNRYAMVYVYPWHVDANKENFVRESFAYNNPGSEKSSFVYPDKSLKPLISER